MYTDDRPDIEEPALEGGSFSAFPNPIIANGHLYLLSYPMQQLPNKERAG